MTPPKKALVVFVITTMGLWGCAKGPAGGSSGPERIKALESKIGKVEEDFRSAASARDQLRSKLAGVEEQRAQLHKEVQALKREREDLRNQVTTRTKEREALQVQFDQFRQGIRKLLGQAEAALGNSQEKPVTEAGATLRTGEDLTLVCGEW